MKTLITIIIILFYVVARGQDSCLFNCKDAVNTFSKVELSSIALLFDSVGQCTNCDQVKNFYKKELKIETQKRKNSWYHYTKYDRWQGEAFILSGIADAFSQAIQFHGYGKGNDFIDYSTSWKRKWKNGVTGIEAFPGSSTIFVWTTDAYHLARSVDHFNFYLGLSISAYEMSNYRKKDRIKVIIFKKLLLPILLRGIAFNLVYPRLGAFGKK
jgi:hypothetical protein